MDRPGTSATGSAGHLVLFLHAHLPYVRHATADDSLEEDWLREAITESYIPLLRVMEGWVGDGVPARVTLSLSPPLMEMLRDDLLIRRYVRHLTRLLELADTEVQRNAHDERFAFTALMYRERLADTLERFQRVYSEDLISAFVAMQTAGVLEIVTSSATHAYLPGFDEDYARTQIRLGAQAFRRHVGGDLEGMWLPECGFAPGLDRLLADEEIGYFLVDSHAVEDATPPSIFGTYAPIVCPTGVCAFPRDRESSALVWSGEWGYPGDGRYREFHRDLGHDLPDDLAEPFLLSDGTRRNLGIKYFRVTGRDVPLDQKEPYHRGWALDAVAQHADDFVSGRTRQIARAARDLGRAPVVVAPYDAELFGHWWFEGPEFLDSVVRKTAVGDVGYRLSTPTDVLDSGTNFQVAMPAMSSWGAFGYSDTWLNDRNDWVWPLVHHASTEMAQRARLRPAAQGVERRVLNQMAREVLLATSSDWPFIITMGTMSDYATARIVSHVQRFDDLVNQLEAGTVGIADLESLEQEDNIFSDIDYRDFTPVD